MCPKKSCRRSVKPFYDPSRYIYCVDDFGKWEIGPLKREDNAHYDRALAAMIFRLTDEHQPSRKLRRRVMAARYDELDEKIGDGSMEPHQWLKGEDWDDWKTLYWHRSTWLKVTVVNGDSGKWCLSCGGGAIRVGSNFRVPGRRDERGWKKERASKRVELAGDGLLGAFAHEWKEEDKLRRKSRLLEIPESPHGTTLDCSTLHEKWNVSSVGQTFAPTAGRWVVDLLGRGCRAEVQRI